MTTTTEEKLRMYRLLHEHESWVDTLIEALEAEEQGEEKFKREGWGQYYGWEWFNVHTPAATLNKMVSERILDITLHTRSGTHYRIRDSQSVREILEVLLDPGQQVEVPTEVPDDLFDLIVGHDNVKTLVRYAINAEKAVHLLFTGPPASAKTLFLMELRRLPYSVYCLAQTVSQAGLSTLLFNTEPQYLLIDEIDRLAGEHIGVLNSLMATGIISETKFRKTRALELRTKVFAAGIKIQTLPKDLLSRFTRLRFEPYDSNEFVEVSSKVLSTMEGIEEELSSEIARAVWAKSETSSDVRQCVQIARLCGGDPGKAREILKILKRY